jgi:hypothetical protein
MSNETIDALIKIRGQELYDTFDGNERVMVQIGMLPAKKTIPFQDNLELELSLDGNFESPYNSVDIARLLTVAVMDAANRGNQKMVV